MVKLFVLIMIFYSIYKILGFALSKVIFISRENTDRTEDWKRNYPVEKDISHKARVISSEEIKE